MEDASRISYPLGDALARIALCDGASESAFAKEWARILARAFVYRPIDLAEMDEESFANWLASCEKEWNQTVPWEFIPWHGEAKTRAGALATLLGMTVSQMPNSSGAFPWRAMAVGDCCLFVVRDDALVLSFPLEDPSQFDNTPPLICSNPANNAGLWPRLHQLNGECLPGDLIVLASDALACWILQQRESGGKPWEILLSLRSDAEWDDWVQAQRSQRAMRNDDTTLISVKVG